MPKLAANLTFLYNEHEFLDRFAAAAKAGFKAVEYLLPYAYEKQKLVDLLGQHGLAYSLLAFAAIALHRRMLWFPVLQQAMQVLPLFVAAHLVSLLVRMVAGDLFPGWTFFIAPCIEALLWPVVTFVYLAPQRRAPDPDENRPL